MKYYPGSHTFYLKGVTGRIFLLCMLCLSLAGSFAQPVTGVWRGYITRGSGLKKGSAPVEIKLIATGDSVLGTAYYYGKGKSYIRYSLKGYFDLADGSVKWQDYHMVDLVPKDGKGARKFKENMKYSADYSCPDGKTLRLDGKCSLPGEPDMAVELKKMDNSLFPDEWDEVIEGYYTGMNRKEVVDSVWALVSEPYVPKPVITTAGSDVALNKIEPGKETVPVKPAERVGQAPPPAKTAVPDTMVAKTAPPKPAPKPTYPTDITGQIAQSNAAKAVPPPTPPPAAADKPKPVTGELVTASAAATPKPVAPITQPVMEQAFQSRKKIVQTEIPVAGDTLELRFYDNAEVDGDSISLFLNGRALFEHVKLGTTPYVFRLPIAGLPDNSELTMVAENLGAIPPNTAYMEAIVKGERYSARLVSTEESSGVVRLVKKE